MCDLCICNAKPGHVQVHVHVHMQQGCSELQQTCGLRPNVHMHKPSNRHIHWHGHMRRHRQR